MTEETTITEKPGKTGRGGSKPKRDDSIWKEEDGDEEPNSRYAAALRAVREQTGSGEVTNATASPTAEREDLTRAPAEREVGGTPFKDAYLTKSVHFIPEVWTAFKDLRPATSKSLTKLQNEAMAWLLVKYGAMTPELQKLFDEFRIEVPPSK
ncbi:MAG: hypothetical protein H0V70_30215 [Ktedonobacteraceae bacterium]|nr:hypothetical protein [Ktedonobacteraceae bacterium]